MDRIIIFSISTFVILSIVISIIPFQALGDGFTQENVFASIGNRKLAMFIKINPPIITSQTLNDRYMYLRFFDANTNQSINNVSFFMNVTQGDQRLMNDLFYTKDGSLTIKFLPGAEPGHWQVIGDQEPFLGGWTSQTDIVNVEAPILSESGLFHFNMSLLGIDYPNELLPANVSVKFNSYLSVGDFYNTTINYKSIPYKITHVSYYDKISSSNFDPSKLQFSWSMPFDWNPARYKDRPILVHEEVRVPNSFAEFTNTPTFSATLNGEPIQNDKIVLDTVSIPDTTIVHLFVFNDTILDMANKMEQNTKTMNFTLYPSGTNVTTSTNIFTDFGGLGVRLDYSPQDLGPFSQNKLGLTFFDQFGGQQVTSDVNYDFKITGSRGGNIVSFKNLIAKGGTDVVPLTLPSNGIYRIQVDVTSINSGGFSDVTRNGVARGNLVIPSVAGQEVIPEFPLTIPILLIGIVSVIAFYQIKFRKGRLCTSQ